MWPPRHGMSTFPRLILRTVFSIRLVISRPQDASTASSPAPPPPPRARHTCSGARHRLRRRVYKTLPHQARRALRCRFRQGQQTKNRERCRMETRRTSIRRRSKNGCKWLTRPLKKKTKLAKSKAGHEVPRHPLPFYKTSPWHDCSQHLSSISRQPSCYQ